MLVFDAVEKRYSNGVAALAGVSFAVPRGQFCAILGHSGAGKSTLLKCVNGLASPTAGLVTVDGQPVMPANLARLRPRIGMIHQSFSLVTRSTVAENVIAGALPAVSTLRALFGVFPASYQRKVCSLIELVGLNQNHLARRVSTLSGGQQQRVGIARAFMLDPDIILADEPVASLDPYISLEILDLIAREARARNATVLCTLHQVDLALRFADRVLALGAGRIAYDGPPSRFDSDHARVVFQGRTEGLFSPACDGCRAQE